MKYEYMVLGYGAEYSRDAVKINCGWIDPSDVAEEAAQDYWDNCDGWESNWPNTFEIFSDGKSVGKFRVQMESTPTFYTLKQIYGDES